MLFDRIKEQANNKGISLTELAIKANIGKNAIYTWKPSKRYPNGVKPRTEALQSVADILGVSVDYLLGNTDKLHESKNTPTDTDLEEMLDGAVAYGGKPMSDNDRTILKGMLKAYFDNKED